MGQSVQGRKGQMVRTATKQGGKMAGSKRRVDSKVNRIKRKMVEAEEGSAVKRLEELPEQEEKRKRLQESRKKSGRRKSISRGYVVFLSFVCVAVSSLCVNYLRQKATITSQYETIAELESEYSQLKNDNDAKYNQVKGSVSMEDVKDAAVNRLGMHYADSDQIKYYDTTDGSYVRQYQDVPTD